MTSVLAALFSLATLPRGAEARPSYFNCNGATWSTSTAVGGMSAGNLRDGSSGRCAITAPASYTAGTAYTITVATNTGTFAYKLVSSAGTLGGGSSGTTSCRNQDSKSASTTFTWTAPATGTGTVNFYAVCGSQSTNSVYLASSRNAAELVGTAAPTLKQTTLSPTSAMPTLSPATASPSSVAPTRSPLMQRYEVRLTMPTASLAMATPVFQSNIESYVASDLGIATSALSVYFEQGSLIAVVVFEQRSGGQNPQQLATTLSQRTPSQMTVVLGMPVSAVSSVSNFVPTLAPSTSGANSGQCFTTTLVTGTYRCRFEPTSDFIVQWSHDGIDIDFELQAKTTGWAAIGFSSSGDMIGSYAPLGYCNGGSGAVTEYYLGGKSTSALNAQTVALAGFSCTEASSVTTLRFRRPLYVTNGYSISLDGNTKVIWAYGESDSLSQHSRDDRGKALMNFATGEASVVKEEDYVLQHSVMMWFGICFFYFFGILSSRFARNLDGEFLNKPLWFWGHVCCQLLGFMFMAIGFWLGYKQVDQVSDVKHYDESSSGRHGQLGCAIFTFGVIQVVGGLVRPHRKDVGDQLLVRVIWEYGHKGLGWLILFLGMINVFLGIKKYNEMKEGEENKWIPLQAIWFVFYAIAEIYYWGRKYYFSGNDGKDANSAARESAMSRAL